jgi:hypothetical protein
MSSTLPPPPPARQPVYGTTSPAERPVTSRRPWYRKKRFLVPILLVVVIGWIGNLGDDDASTAPTSAATQQSEQNPADPASAEAAREAEEAEEAEEQAAQEAEEAAAETQRKADQEATEAAAAAAQAQAEAAAAAATAAAQDPATYAPIDERGWALIAKDPDAYRGAKHVLYGYVSQFDSATGPTAFLARTDGAQHADWFDFEQNTLVQAGDAALLASVVEDDLVTMYVDVLGSFSYDTQIGGNTTVPHVHVNMIEVYGQGG